MLNEARETMQKQSENFNRDRKYKKYQTYFSEVKHIINEKLAGGWLNSRLGLREERMSGFEDR